MSIPSAHASVSPMTRMLVACLLLSQSRDALQAKPVSFADELEAQRAHMWGHGRKELDGPPIDDPGLLRASLIANGQITFDEPIPGTESFLLAFVTAIGVANGVCWMCQMSLLTWR